MNVDLHEQKYGALTDTIRTRKKALALRAAIFFALAGAFLIFLFDFRAFSSGIGWARAALPLILPGCAAAFGLILLNHIPKRVELYERGLVYHTLWFELDAGYDTIRSVTVSQECGREHKQGNGEYSAATSLLPVAAVTVVFQDGKRWGFFGNTYAELAEKGGRLKTYWARAQTAANART